jgi:hypothetical protein
MMLYEEPLKANVREETMARQECSNGIRGRGLKEQLRLGSKRPINVFGD